MPPKQRGKGKEKGDGVSLPWTRKAEKSEANAEPIKLASTPMEVMAQAELFVPPNGILDLCKDHGIPVKPVPNYRPTNTGHPVAHAARTHLVMSALRDSAKDLAASNPNCTVLNIGDVWGKNRSMSLPRMTEGCRVQIVPIQPNYFHGDSARRAVVESPVDQLRLCYSAMLVDIYATRAIVDGQPVDVPLSAQLVADIAAMTLSRTTYIIMHTMPEIVGGYVWSGQRVTVSKEGNTTTKTANSNEQYWHVQNGLVEFFPDEFSQRSYSLSPVAPPWLASTVAEVGRGVLHVSELTVVAGDFALYKCVFNFTPPIGHPFLPITPCVSMHRDIYIAKMPKMNSALANVLRDLMSEVRLMFGYRQPEAMEGCLTFAGDTAYRSRRTDQNAALIMGLRAINGLFLAECYSASVAFASRDSGLVYADTKLSLGIIRSIACNAVAYAVIESSPKSLIAGLDSFRAAHRELEEARKRVTSPSVYEPPNFVWENRREIAMAFAVAYLAWQLYPSASFLSRFKDAQRRATARYVHGLEADSFFERVIHPLIIAPIVGGSESARWLVQSNPWIARRMRDFESIFRGAPADMDAEAPLFGFWQYLLSVISGAFFEETLRSISPKAGFAMAVVEYVSYVNNGVPWQTRIVPLLMHVRWHRLAVRRQSFGRRLTEHVGYNLLCTAGLLMHLQSVGMKFQPFAPRKDVAELMQRAVAAYTPYFITGALDPTAPDHSRGPMNASLLHAWAPWYAHGVMPNATIRGIQYLPTQFRVRAGPTQATLPQYLTHHFEGIRVVVDGGTPMYGQQAFATMKELARSTCMCDLMGVCSDCKNAGTFEFSHPLILFSASLYRPTLSLASGYFALANRLCRDPTGEREMFSSIVLESAWNGEVATRIEQTVDILCQMPVRLERLPTVEECADALDSKKRRAFLQTWQEMQLGNYDLRAHASVKHNEWIKFKDEGIIPRMIIGFDNAAPVLLAQYARELMRALKAHFNFSVIQHIPTDIGIIRQVRLVIAHPTPDDLTSYASSQDGIPVVVVSGDDQLAFSGNSDILPFRSSTEVEGDFAMFDATVIEAIQNGIRRAYSAWGLDTVWISLIAKLCALAIVFKRGRRVQNSISGRVHMQLPTGISVTSITGSLVTILVWTHAIRKCISIEDAAEDFGMNLKVQYLAPGQGTFLRGWWPRNKKGDGVVWARLPSPVKLCKILPSPVMLLRQGDASHALMFRAVMESTNVDEDYPILGALLVLSRRLAGRSARADAVIRDPYIFEGHMFKVNSATGADRNCVLELMRLRYSLSVEEIVDAEKMLLSITSLPVFVSHPVFDRLRDVDYDVVRRV